MGLVFCFFLLLLSMQNILLLHGALGTRDDLSPLAEQLEKSGFCVFALSFSGHGKTTQKEHVDILQFSKEVQIFIDQNKINDLTIFGYSMGGYVALYLASQQKKQIKKVITLGTKFDWTEKSLKKEIDQLDPEIISERLPKFAERLAEKHGDSWKNLMYITVQLMQNIAIVQYLKEESLKKIDIPVLLGIGDKDQMVSLDETVNVYKILKNASMFMLPKTKHPIETVNINLLSQIISDFIRT